MQNPRYTLWLRVTGGGPLYEFVVWAIEQSREYMKERGIRQITDDDDYDDWLQKKHAAHTNDK